MWPRGSGGKEGDKTAQQPESGEVVFGGGDESEGEKIDFLV